MWAYLIDRITRPEVLTAEWRVQQERDPTADDLPTVERALVAVLREQQNVARAVATLADDGAGSPLLAELRALAERKHTLEADRERLLARRRVWQEARDRLDLAEQWCHAIAEKAIVANYDQKRALLGLMEATIKVYATSRTPRYVGEAWVPTYVAEGSDPVWRRELFNSACSGGGRHAQALEGFAGQDGVAEGGLLAADDGVLEVAAAGDQDRVARPGQLHRPLDRLPALVDPGEVAAGVA